MSIIKDYSTYIKENYIAESKEDKKSGDSKSYSLTQKEKDFLWAKMEVKKKAKAKETESDVYKMLQGDKKIDSLEDFIKILNSLEYSMKKRVRTGDAPKGKYTEAFNSLQKKLPEEWVGVKYSSLKAKSKREDKKPTESDTKKDIAKWLDKKKIKYTEEDTKKDLLKKVNALT